MLLEAERAGVTVLSEMNKQVEDQQLKPILEKFLRDEGINCRTLVSLIHHASKPSYNKAPRSLLQGASFDKSRIACLPVTASNNNRKVLGILKKDDLLQAY